MSMKQDDFSKTPVCTGGIHSLRETILTWTATWWIPELTTTHYAKCRIIESRCAHSDLLILAASSFRIFSYKINYKTWTKHTVIRHFLIEMIRLYNPYGNRQLPSPTYCTKYSLLNQNRKEGERERMQKIFTLFTKQKDKGWLFTLTSEFSLRWFLRTRFPNNFTVAPTSLQEQQQKKCNLTFVIYKNLAQDWHHVS